MASTSSPPPPTVAERLVACRSLLTSLPYVDDDLLSVPDVQQRVEALIREEMGRFSPPDYLAAPHPSAAATQGLDRRAGTAGSSGAAGAAGGAAGAAEEAAGAGAAEAGSGKRPGGVSVFLAAELERVNGGVRALPARAPAMRAGCRSLPGTLHPASTPPFHSSPPPPRPAIPPPTVPFRVSVPHLGHGRAPRARPHHAARRDARGRAAETWAAVLRRA